MNTSLYIHIPFCRHRCAYCDFNTYAGQEDWIPAYVEALRREIEYVGPHAPHRLPVHTVFFGGGTPSLLAPAQFETVLEAIRCHFELAADAEITVEANPGTVSLQNLTQMRAMGINRISFGAQSANGEELRMLERTHTFLDVMQAVRSARRAGFDNLNLDLIYGLPSQEQQTWRTSVRRVLELEPDHISAYALTLEHGTPFGRWAARGLLTTPDPDAAAEMYEWAGETLEAAEYEQYEISNWGTKKPSAFGSQLSASDKRSAACRHNLQYWRGLPYLGLGAGAHGYAGGYRYSNVLRIATYIERLVGEPEARRKSDRGNGEEMFPMSPAAVNTHPQSPQDDMSEFMITGLRLTGEGIHPAEFERRFSRTLTDVYGRQLEELVRVGLLEAVKNETSGPLRGPEVIRLTTRGRLLGNQVFLRFV